MNKNKPLLQERQEKLGPYRMLDAWRALASLSVISFHWGEIVLHDHPAAAENPVVFLSRYGFLGVQIFFVISGYCITSAGLSCIRRGSGVGDFLLARIRRIYPSYWAALLLALGFDYAGYCAVSRGLIHASFFTQNNPLSASPLYYLISAVLVSMALLHNPGILSVAWTLNYEVAFYSIVAAAFYAAGYLQKKTTILSFLTLLHIVTLLSLVGLILRTPMLIFPLDLWPQFGFGVLVCDLLSHPRARRAKIFGLAILALTLVFITVCDVPLAMSQPSRLTFSVAIVFAVALLALYRFDGWASQAGILRALSFVGIFSYSLYLTHVVTLHTLNIILKALHFSTDHIYLFLVAYICTMGIGYLFFLIAERPILQWNMRSRKTKVGLEAPADPQSIPLPAASGVNNSERFIG